MKTSAMVTSSIRELRELASMTIPPSDRDVKSYCESRRTTSPIAWTLTVRVLSCGTTLDSGRRATVCRSVKPNT